MEKIAVLFPSSDEFFVMPSLRWVAEYYACMRSEVFEPVLFWQRGFMDFGELALERPAKTKTQWCILRCNPIGLRRFEGLRHALARNGYRLAFHDGWCDHYRTSHDNSLSTLLRPETVIPYQNEYGPSCSKRGSWLPGGDSYRRRLPMVAAISAFTFPTTVSSLALAGFELLILDVEEGTFNVSCDEVERVAGSIGLLAPTHFLGFPCDLERISELAGRHGFLVLQDACETMGMRIAGKDAFSYGDITTLSFYHPHHMSSYGGGAVITLSQDDFLLADSVAHWGRNCKCHVDESLCKVPEGPAHQFTYERLGVNVEMSELNASFGRWQLRSWDEMEAKRRRNYAILRDRLRDKEGIQVWDAPDVGRSAFVFPVRLCNGMNVTDAWRILKAEGIEIRTLMGGVSNEQVAFREILDSATLRIAHVMAETTFFVGIHQTLPEEDVRHVAKTLSAFL